MSNKNKYNDILKLNICEKDSNTFHRNKNQLTLGNVDEGFIEEVKILTELFFISEFYEPDPKNRGRLMIKEKYHNLLNLNSNCEEYDDYWGMNGIFTFFTGEDNLTNGQILDFINDEKNRITDVQFKEGSIIISLFIKLTKETLVCILENAIRKSMKDFFRFLSREEVETFPYENKFSTFINKKIKKFKQKYNIVMIKDISNHICKRLIDELNIS